MSQQCSIVIIAVPAYDPGRFVLIRADRPNTRRQYVWCGRSLGWLPFKTTSSAFFRFFASQQEAEKAADKYVTLSLLT